MGRFGVFSKAFIKGNSAIVELDDETQMPWRDPETGFCRRVKDGEPGEFLAKLPADDIGKKFQGYFGNKNATSSKIMRDVFKKGDAWYGAPA